MAKHFPNLMNSMNMYTHVISSMKSKQKVQRDPHGTHCNQKQRQKENLQRGKRKATCYKVSSVDFQKISQQKTCRPENSKKELKGQKNQLRWIQFFKKYKNKQSLLVVTMDQENGPGMILRFFFFN